MSVTVIEADLLTSLCKNGLPTGDIFEFAAIQVLKYERKWKQQQRVELQERIMRREKEKELKKLEQRRFALIAEKRQYEMKKKKLEEAAAQQAAIEELELRKSQEEAEREAKKMAKLGGGFGMRSKRGTNNLPT